MSVTVSQLLPALLLNLESLFTLYSLKVTPTASSFYASLSDRNLNLTDSFTFPPPVHIGCDL